jgi:hypothetical protein
MKVLDIPKSGKRGDIVSFKIRYGQCERQHVARSKRRSAAERRAQGEFGSASLGWNEITEEQRYAWRAGGKKVRSHPRGGQSGPLTGQTLFTAINRNQALIGLDPFVYPPARPAFSPNPVGALSITQGRGGIALKLSVSKAPVEHILVYGARPYNAGRPYCDKFIYLGLLPVPESGMSDITKLYVKKHGKPWAGSRVIIRTVQQVNGWRDNPQRTEAIVPGEPGSAAQPKRRRATVAA